MSGLLKREAAALLVIDVQERINAVMADQSHLPRIEVLAEACSGLKVPVIGSEQYPRGLGPTVPSLAETIDEFAAKLTFSCFRDPELRTSMESTERRQIRRHRHRDPRLCPPDRSRSAGRRLSGLRSPRRRQFPPSRRQGMGPPSDGAGRSHHHLHRISALRAASSAATPRTSRWWRRRSNGYPFLSFEFPSIARKILSFEFSHATPPGFELYVMLNGLDSTVWEHLRATQRARPSVRRSKFSRRFRRGGNSNCSAMRVKRTALSCWPV